MISLYINNLAGQNKVISPLGNSVTVNLNTPIVLDDHKNYHMRLLQANIVYCTPNVFQNVNNQLSYTFNGNNRTIVFNQGLFTIDDINRQIAIFTSETEGIPSLIELLPDTSTSKIYLVFNRANITVHCGATYSILPTLGFPTSTGDISNGSSYPDYVISTNQANLNSIQNIYIKCDIVTGSYQNAQTSNIIASVIPNVLPYSTIQYVAQYPTRMNITSRNIGYITITLVDDSGKDIDLGTNNGTLSPELWSVLITISQDELMTHRTMNV